MNLRQHLRPLGLLVSLMLLITATTAIVALRLQQRPAPATTQDATGSAPIAVSPQPDTGQAGGAQAASVQQPAAAKAPGGQCVSGATSLVESAALDGGIGGGLGAMSFPTATPYPAAP